MKTCGGTFFNGPLKRYVRCDRCRFVNFEANEGDTCTRLRASGMGRLRERQAFAAAGAAGPLLDAWDGLGQDTREDPLLADVAAAVAALREAMEGVG